MSIGFKLLIFNWILPQFNYIIFSTSTEEKQINNFKRNLNEYMYCVPFLEGSFCTIWMWENEIFKWDKDENWEKYL
jgi:surface polysaccharide O-acyltransferase-like enzyme